MKWTTPHDGDRRIVKRFLFVPLCIDDNVRWLETVYISQGYEEGREISQWLDKAWSTKERYRQYKDKLADYHGV